MIYFLFAMFFVFFAFSACRIKKVDKHDRVLFPFCQLRRDIMRFLRDNMETVTQEEYRSLRTLLTMLDNTIYHYNRHKTRMFNLRKILKHMLGYQDAKKQVEKIVMPDNSAIKEFYTRFVRLLVQAFLAYTPWLRWEITLQLTGFVVRRFLHDRVDDFLTVAGQIRGDAQRLNVDGRLRPA